MNDNLPPLPIENYIDIDGLWSEKYGPYTADQMRAYARAALAVRGEPLTLTDEQIIDLTAWEDYLGGCITLLDFARAVLAAAQKPTA